MEQLVTQALELSPLGIAALALLVSLALLRKYNNKGNGGNDKSYKLLQEMKTNDMHNLDGKMHDLDYKMDKLISSNQEQTYILKDIKTLLQKK